VGSPWLIVNMLGRPYQPPLVSAGVAIWAILVAKKTISESKEIAKKTIADTAYQAYLQLAMENPQFSKGYSADNCPNSYSSTN
jgi:hypothetical protein